MSTDDFEFCGYDGGPGLDWFPTRERDAQATLDRAKQIAAERRAADRARLARARNVDPMLPCCEDSTPDVEMMRFVIMPNGVTGWIWPPRRMTPEPFWPTPKPAPMHRASAPTSNLLRYALRGASQEVTPAMLWASPQINPLWSSANPRRTHQPEFKAGFKPVTAADVLEAMNLGDLMTTLRAEGAHTSLPLQRPTMEHIETDARPDLTIWLDEAAELLPSTRGLMEDLMRAGRHPSGKSFVMRLPGLWDDEH